MEITYEKPPNGTREPLQQQQGLLPSRAHRVPWEPQPGHDRGAPVSPPTSVCGSGGATGGLSVPPQSLEAGDLSENTLIILIFINRPRLRKARNDCDFCDLKLISIHFLDTKQNVLNWQFASGTVYFITSMMQFNNNKSLFYGVLLSNLPIIRLSNEFCLWHCLPTRQSKERQREGGKELYPFLYFKPTRIQGRRHKFLLQSHGNQL